MGIDQFRTAAGEYVTEYGLYLGDNYPTKNCYHVLYEGVRLRASGTGELADKVAAAMRSNAARKREQIKRRIREM